MAQTKSLQQITREIIEKDKQWREVDRPRFIELIIEKPEDKEAAKNKSLKELLDILEQSIRNLSNSGPSGRTLEQRSLQQLIRETIKRDREWEELEELARKIGENKIENE